MGFKVVVSVTAAKDLNDAIHYYSQINQIFPERFHGEFLELITLPETQPFFEKKYDTIRTCKLKSFSYLTHFIINEEASVVKIIAVTFGKRGNTNFGYRMLEP